MELKVYFLVHQCVLFPFNFQTEEIKKKYSCHYAALMAENLIAFKSRQSYDSLRNSNLIQNTELSLLKQLLLHTFTENIKLTGSVCYGS